MLPKLRVSLANKCQILFGVAVVLIIGSALVVGWLRMRTLVLEGNEEVARRLGTAWLSNLEMFLADTISDTTTADPTIVDSKRGPSVIDEDLTITLITRDKFEAVRADSKFLNSAISRFEKRPEQDEWFRQIDHPNNEPYFHYARAIRKSDLTRIRNPELTDEDAGDRKKPPETPVESTALANPVEMVLEVQLNAAFAEKQLMMNRIYIIAAGVLAGLMAIGTFWYITTRIILSPVRVLRDVTQKVSEGDLNIRSDINTGDEFEQFSGVFNQMLENLKSNQEELRTVNKSLDLKLGELAETNVALYEANKIKGEFLANVSHELRTPLHSMIGFAEVLGETLQDRTGPVDEKRKRYVANIISSSRSLLHLITDLLDVAKIEAGRMDLTVSQMSVADTAEGLINLIRPQAGKRNIELRLKIDSNLPMVETDAGKFQQIIFNFLSNAVKFTAENGFVELSAQIVAPAGPGRPKRLRTAVTDNGPGIPPAEHEMVFEKFTQRDQGVTREHVGTGLGLTISKDLAKLLGGSIDLDSDSGRGATFALSIPVVMTSQSAPLMPDEAPSAAGSIVE